MPDKTFHRWVPEVAEVDGEELVLSLDLDEDAPAERPYVLVNFVVSADGRTVFAGRSSPFSDPGDRILFHALRERVDAVLAGTRTLAAERYGRMIPAPERRERRLAAGRPGEPLACVVTRSGIVPTDIPLFAEPDARVAVFAPEESEVHPPAVRAHVAHYVLDPDAPRPFAEVLRRLRHEHDVRLLLCEGGATTFGALLREGVVDELFLTLSPSLAGGTSGPGVTSGPPLEELAGLRVRWLLTRGDTLYLRYALVASH